MNKVVHFEVPYDDQERAMKFYSEVFGWKLNDMPEMRYTMVHTVESDKDNMPKEFGAINGGMLKRDETSPGPLLVIDVPSMDDHLKKIEKAGGEVVFQKVQVGDMGLYARVKDPEGNIIGIWEDLMHKS
jgi:uncharacterized protein